jgi:hypothetical protein
MRVLPDIVSASVAVGISAVTAITTLIAAHTPTNRREHEADWRKLKFHLLGVPPDAI